MQREWNIQDEDIFFGGEKHPDWWDEKAALALLLLNEEVWFRIGKLRGTPDDIPGATMLYAGCNDIFAWGCADQEPINSLAELREIYEAYSANPKWGVALWCIKRRGMMPQFPVARDMRADGVDLDSMGLERNFYDIHCEKMAAERAAKKAAEAA